MAHLSGKRGFVRVKYSEVIELSVLRTLTKNLDQSSAWQQLGHDTSWTHTCQPPEYQNQDS